MIPNYSPSSSTNASTAAHVYDLVDGIVDEGGYFSVQHQLLGVAWEHKIAVALKLQQSGKAYYSVNEFGVQQFKCAYAPSSSPSASLSLPPPCIENEDNVDTHNVDTHN